MCGKAHGLSAVIYVSVQVLVYLLISNIKPRLFLSCMCVCVFGKCFLTAWALSLQSPVLLHLWDVFFFPFWPTKKKKILYVFDMCIWSAVGPARLACLFSDLPPDQTSHWVTMGMNQEDHVLQSSWHTRTHTSSLFLRSVSVCLWKVALKHTIHIHSHSIGESKGLSRGLFSDIVVF